ncbi:TPA: hypothetical protein KRD69_003147 [Clostridioides difficile]|uniref:hypothetical protein n=1 Tax=Clostridioides difficile TaxID=1496 RepID=UPI001C1933AC|nr:hypothetical protein [Clostridioides difficile]MCK3749349.1 hypothetical protein [Clostridioides difficile]MCR8821078.1 hypothetical protein [Clostridioides difficile]MCZ1086946.1 hypothetical protein [Clostridioides difficile]HBG7268497.1 hypothetical protein [Clostridioides difficile]
MNILKKWLDLSKNQKEKEYYLKNSNDMDDFKVEYEKIFNYYNSMKDTINIELEQLRLDILIKKQSNPIFSIASTFFAAILSCFFTLALTSFSDYCENLLKLSLNLKPTAINIILIVLCLISALISVYFVIKFIRDMSNMGLDMEKRIEFSLIAQKVLNDMKIEQAKKENGNYF